MRRYVWGQLRHRRFRGMALLLGILVATTSFTVLTGTTRTSRLETIGTITHNFRPAYDILVRPHESTTELESQQQLVRPNYLSGIFGGIRLDQYDAIRSIEGIDVAAPIAMVGYVLQTVTVPVDLTASLGAGPRQIFRVTSRRTTDRGLSKLVDLPADYVYVTARPLQPDRQFMPAPGTVTGPKERLGDGRKVVVCPAYTKPRPTQGPFDQEARQHLLCWSRRTGEYGFGFFHVPPGHVAALVRWQFPFLVAAIDPVQEAELDAVDTAVVDGRYLRTTDDAAVFGDGPDATLRVPVLAASRPYADDHSVVTVRRLGGSAITTMTAGLPPEQLRRRLAGEDGPLVLRRRIDGATAYRQLLEALSRGEASNVDNFWSGGPTQYRQLSARRLAPVAVRNPDRVWKSRYQSGGYVIAPIDAADTAFRPISPHIGSTRGQFLSLPALRTVGQFDPERLPGFSPLSQVPLETYQPPLAAPGDDRTRQLLGGRDLLPNGNLAGYLQTPPLLLTTLAALPAFTDPHVFTGVRNARKAPISAIRVRVSGVTGPDPVSRERIRLVAEQIAARTGLDVDITAGSSPTPMTIDLPAGRFGRPALTLREEWVEKGVVVAILDALDRKSLVLFVLILAVCALFVANAASAAVRTRRTELGVLACLGWRTHKLFAAVLLEVGLIGFAAGVLGGLLALPLSVAFGLSISLARAGLAVPAAVALAVLAGLVPAWQAARIDPGAAVHPALLPVRRGRAARSVTGLAMRNLMRSPGRSLIGAASLAVGVCALTLLLAVTLAFRGQVIGSLLGDAISVQARTTDYVAAALTVALGVLAIADVLYLNIRERAAEFATLRALGWREGPLTRLVAFEGVGMGLIGSLCGAAAGLAAAGSFAGHVPPALFAIAVVAVAVGTLLTAAAALVSATALRRLGPAQALAEE